MAAAGRQRLGIILGGRSGEHEVSVVSAQHVIAAADKERFDVVPIGIARSGAWLTVEETAAALARDDAAYEKSLHAGSGGAQGPLARPSAMGGPEALARVDVVFPLIHGPYGEDGTLQGLLEMADVPYVGAGVAASAIGLDKALMKALFAQAGLPVPDYRVVLGWQWEADRQAVTRELEAAVPYPWFVKPANGGSSVGITKVRSREDLSNAVQLALRFDRKLVVERGMQGREVECAVLGNDDPQTSPLGEIVYQREFYDYEAKYLDSSTQLIAPAKLAAETAARIQSMAVRAYRAIDCAGMGRVDFFLLPDGSVCLEEINTIPGFTPISMFPRLWQLAGLTYSQLITRLVDLALERHEEKRRRA
jgi:D-alanine-D-alanine ligase